MSGRRLDPGKAAVIVCVSDEDLFARALGYLECQNAAGLSLEVLPVRGAESMCAGYERARLASDAKYKVYMHQDVMLWRADLLAELVRQFRRSPQVGLIGIAGCVRLPPSGIWWQADDIYNCVAIPDGHGGLRRYKGRATPPVAVDAVDGLLMATQGDVPWRSDLFKGWHFYDISQCMEYRRRGYKVGLARQDPELPWVLHLSPNDAIITPEYEEQRAVFLREYAADLGAGAKD